MNDIFCSLATSPQIQFDMHESIHQSIQQLQPLNSWGPSNHRSHNGLVGPFVLSKHDGWDF
uniref:Uncharacterized protein n=1 Tax=Rhizophora mucronata TaxID=61149 RepID=A0A2P2PSM1_RHIMU